MDKSEKISKTQELSDLKAKWDHYEKITEQLDEVGLSIKTADVESRTLQIEMATRKGFYWLNTIKGKFPLVFQKELQEKEKEKNSKKSKKDEKPQNDPIEGVSVNSVAWF